MADIIYRYIPVKRAVVDLEKRSFPLIASTEEIDTYDTVIDSKTWNLRRFKVRGPVLYSHNPMELPIGIATNTRVDGTELKADCTIVSNRANPKADNYLHSVNEGSLEGVSVGFMPGDCELQERDGREVLVLKNCELIEISLTPTNSNPSALVELRSTARKKQEMKKKKKPLGQRADGTEQEQEQEEEREEAPPLSDREASIAYISAATGDVEGLDPEMAKQVSAAITTRVDACYEAGGAASEEDPNMRGICTALSTREVSVKTSEEALAVVTALVQNARSGNLSAEAQERATLIQGAIADTRISEGMQTKEYMESLNKYSLPALRIHLKSLKPQLPLGKRTETKKPGAEDTSPDIGDKPWDKLTYVEKAKLQRSDPERARALKEASSKSKPKAAPTPTPTKNKTQTASPSGPAKG